MATQHDTRGGLGVGRPRPPADDAIDSTTTAPDLAPRRRRPSGLVAAAAALAVGLAVGGYLMTRDGEPSVTVTDRGPAEPAAQLGAIPAGLRVSLAGPTRVAVGTPAAFTVTYTDDAGEFVGSVQDWGDIGDGYERQGRCPGGSVLAHPLRDSFVASHTWTAPGTYRVKITVTTRTCEGGAPATEDASASTTVVVEAP